MRSIQDQAGITWDVAVGKESYGSMVLFFSRLGNAEVRRCPIEASSRLEAERMLSAFSQETLRSKLTAASTLGNAAPTAGGAKPMAEDQTSPSHRMDD
ncbi:MAG: hypothetical protein OER43_12955 [Gammaproteobacteria bacterium]|nr:hypothetical protein [Gammaproteobacteria bacterium]MDH3413641.1 hypothetical protein [Gammaproteobacteria bacterium]